MNGAALGQARLRRARTWLLCGALAGALAVLFGAFGAHALKGRLAPELLQVYHTAWEYHAMHALGLFAVGVLALQRPASGALRWAAGLMLLGLVLFSGSLYLLSLSGVRLWGAVTPFGGVALIAAWLCVAVAVREF